MLGVYDYTVILTYISLWISIGGMMLSLNGHLDLAVLCLALSGLCDMFDGKIARTKKDRTEIEKRFGIQIDSLCDIVCFGVGPAIICYCMGMNGIVGVLILMFYVLAGLLRDDLPIGFWSTISTPEIKFKSPSSEANVPGASTFSPK